MLARSRRRKLMHPLEQVREFRDHFGLHTVSINTFVVGLEEELLELESEILNFRAAETPGSAWDHRAAKEACDVVYTILGLFLARGWDFEAAFAEVHRSNMSKSHTKILGKVQKGPDYSPADLRGILLPPAAP